MNNIVNFPLLIFTFSFIALWLSALIGAFCRKKLRPLDKDQQEDFGVIQAAALTLLSLLIGFTFSMAISRYDQRKNYEEAEANAIGTEYVRADFLPPDDAAKVHDLLIRYLDERVLFYTTRDDSHLAKIDAETVQLQSELWIAVRPAAEANPTPVVALVVSGMNDVLNSQGYTQAAWWNRIPVAAWGMMAVIAVSCNLLIGYGAHGRDWRTLLIVPIVVSIAFFLISDIDSPRGGAIRVAPHNLISLSKSLRSQ